MEGIAPAQDCQKPYAVAVSTCFLKLPLHLLLDLTIVAAGDTVSASCPPAQAAYPRALCSGLLSAPRD
jgi:hypothetical protein